MNWPTDSRAPLTGYASTAKFLFWAAVLLLTAVAYANYSGNGLIFLSFSFISNGLLYSGFRRNAIFFDAFIGVLCWLGFWLKVAVRVTFFDGKFIEATGYFDGSAAAFDQALIVASCGLAGFWVSSIIRERIFPGYSQQNAPQQLEGLSSFYLKHRRAVLVSFVALFLIVGVTNAYWGIYQRGSITRTTLPFGLNGVYTWLLLFGFSSISALILRFEFDSRKQAPYLALFLGLLESFASNVSIMSRGMILNSSALLLGAFASFNFHSMRAKARFFSIGIGALLLLFASSVLTVNYLRSQVYLDSPQEAQKSLLATEQMTNRLFLDRWVGIEGVMAASSYPGLGWDLWRSAWHETYNENETSFYDQKLITSPYVKTDKSKHHFVSLPGIVAFFYYPGSLTFLFIGMLCLGWLASGVEVATYRLGGGNLILCALLSQVVAFRFTSFGYVPKQSYLLFGTIALNVAIIFLADKVIRRHFNAKK